MTQFFFPFTSIDGDRRYNAKDFATYFHSIFTDGVIATVKDKLRVSESEATGMHVVVNAGAAFIHGHLYLLSEPLTVDVTPGNSTGDRVDSIVLQLDHLERDMKILYKQNSTSVQRDENYWELQLATINVPRNATKVLNSQINDKRADEGVAGYSKLQGNLDVEGMEQHYESLLQQLSTDMAQWVTGKKVDFQGDWDAWFTTTQNTLDQLVTDMQSWSTDKQAEFDIWFENIQDILDSNVAGNLQNQITQLEEDLGNVDAPSTQEFESLQSDFSAHQAEKVHQGEIHGFRLTDSKLEYFDGAEWQRVKGDGYPVGNIGNFEAKGDDTTVELTWTDPEDVTVTDSNGNVITIARWKGTKILRKTGSYPQNENDGVLVVDNGIRDQYATAGFVDTGLVNDTDYYYMAFPYTEEDVFTVDELNRVVGTPSEIKIYGVEIDENNSNPETSVTYTDDAVGFTPMAGNNGNHQWGSWESVFNELDIKPCLVKNGTVNYYLNPNDFTKKADGSVADITSGNDGDVMIEFPKLYWEMKKNGTKQHVRWSVKPFPGAECPAHTIGSVEKDKIYVSAYMGHNLSEKLRSLSGKTPTVDQTIGTFRSQAQANGSGYQQMGYYPLLMLQVLYIVFYKSRDSQTALGRGYVDGNSSSTTTGATNKRGMFYGETTGKQQNKFCGIEDFWGNVYYWIDGFYSDNNRNLMISKQDVFNDNGSGYVDHGQGATANLGGYIDTVQGGTNTGFVIKSSNGSATTHYSDYGVLTGGYLARFGGTWSDGSNSGAFQLQVNTSASYSNSALGARLCFIGN